MEHRADFDTEKRERARALYEEQTDPPRSVRDVAELLGLSVSRTHTLLRESGAQMRRPGSPGKESDGNQEPPAAEANDAAA